MTTPANASTTHTERAIPSWLDNASPTLSVIWTSLVEDSSRSIVVCDRDGRVWYANDRAAEHVGMDRAASMRGATIEEVCEAEYAQERLALIREVIDRDTPLAVEGMTRGRWYRTVMRPLSAPVEPTRLALLVHIPVPPRREGERVTHLDYEVYRAKIDDYGPLKSLTARELEVLRLIAQGNTTAEVARLLHRSVKTVEWHRVSLGTKLDVSNRVELARIAIRAGLVDVENALENRVEAAETADTQPGDGPTDAG